MCLASRTIRITLGMLIEGNGANYEIMIQTRPCTQNVWSAICPKRRSHIFMTNRMGTSEQVKNHTTMQRGDLILTPCRPLSDIFREYNVKKIDFMSLDVEGAEADVLATINFERVEISVIIAENDRLGSNGDECILANSTSKCRAVDRIMSKAGMFKVPSDGKDLPACITGDRRQSIRGSSVYVSQKFRDDIC